MLKIHLASLLVLLVAVVNINANEGRIDLNEMVGGNDQDPIPPPRSPDDEHLANPIVRALTVAKKAQNMIDGYNDRFRVHMERKNNEMEKKLAKYFEERAQQIAAIPNFWMDAFLRHPDRSNWLSPMDKKLLENLKSLHVARVHSIKHHTAYRIEMTFPDSANDVVRPQKLWRIFYADQEPLHEDSHLHKRPGEDEDGDGSDRASGFYSSIAETTDFKLFQFFSKDVEENTPTMSMIGHMLAFDMWTDPTVHYFQEDTIAAGKKKVEEMEKEANTRKLKF
eukprot:PhF_6_TR41031/c0_g1_i1/m.62151/K11290/SET, TAF1, I2PP2A; template-activating factor I